MRVIHPPLLFFTKNGLFTVKKSTKSGLFGKGVTFYRNFKNERAFTSIWVFLRALRAFKHSDVYSMHSVYLKVQKYIDMYHKVKQGLFLS